MGNPMGSFDLLTPIRAPWTFRVILAVAAALLLALVGCGPAPADLVLTGGSVYTLDWPDPGSDGTPDRAAPHDPATGWQPDAQAIAITDGAFVFVGSDAEAQRLIGSNTRVVALDGAVVLPGLIETHTHVAELGTKLAVLDLTGVATPDDAISLAADWAADLPDGAWVIGHGWDEGAWASAYPDSDALSARIPDHPVLLRGLHGFAAWGNERAFQAAGIDAETPDPVGGEILRRPNGGPLGVVLNRAVPLLEAAVPTPSAAERQARLLRGLEAMAQAGYVSVHEAGVPRETLEDLESLDADDRLPLPVYVMLSARDASLMEEWIARGPDDSDRDGMLRVRAVKAYYDGSLGSRGARLIQDYADQPGHRGVSGDGYGFDQELVERAIDAGFQVGIHAIGDAGNRETLDFLEVARLRNPQQTDARHRVEHAQVIASDDLSRFSALDLIASMQPPHAVEDMPWAEDRLGADRIRGAYAWRTLREEGARLIFSADLPGSDHSFFYGLHSAVTRQNRMGQPEGGWYAGEALSVEEAIRAYTTWAAFAGFVEDRGGRIAPGLWADLTIIDLDPFRVAEERPSALLDGNVLRTFVRGNELFRSPD